MLNYNVIQNVISVEKGKRTKELLEKCIKQITPTKKKSLLKVQTYIKELQDTLSVEAGFSSVIEAFDTLNQFFNKDAPLVMAIARKSVPRKPRNLKAERARRAAIKARVEAEKAKSNPTMASQVA